MKKYIHFFKTKEGCFVILTTDGEITRKSEKFKVSNIKEARAISIKRGLMSLNFNMSGSAIKSKSFKMWTYKKTSRT